VPLPLGAPSRPPQVAGRDATIHHMGLPGTTGQASFGGTRTTEFLQLDKEIEDLSAYDAD
jgi:hypothetical protein